MVAMYADSLEFLDEERDAWRPFEALESLTDEQLERHVDAAHGWSGRDLIGHLVAWQEHAVAVARELAVGETSATKIKGDADWDTGGDAINERLIGEWAAMPIDEVRRRFRTIPGELRGYLTVVPERRWLKDPDNLHFFQDETVDHYEGHRSELEAILDAARRDTDG